MTVLDRALTATPSEVVMPVDSPSSQQKPVLQGSTEGKTVVRVPSVPLSDAVAKLPDRIDLLKMDIERSEFEVLLRAPRETLRRRASAYPRLGRRRWAHISTPAPSEIPSAGILDERICEMPRDDRGTEVCDEPNRCPQRPVLGHHPDMSNPCAQH